MSLPRGGVLLFLLAGCAAPAPLDSERILRVAQTYADFGCVDDLARFAPTLCQPPPPLRPRQSASRDEGTHGRKLYYLFAKDRSAYLQSKDRAQPLGQVLVKEAWSALEGATSDARGTSLVPLAGKYFHTGEKTGLFIMMKTGQEDTDGGWIYATASADGQAISAAGKIASCMECHQGAPSDRVFGLTSCAAAK